jgi:paraquat-inducible protein B
MSLKASPTRIGIFVILSFALFVAGIVVFGGGKMFSKKNTAIVYFEGSLQGLNVGAPVAYRGITIGEVKEIKVSINADTYQIIVPVLISLMPDKMIQIKSSATDTTLNSFLKTMIQRGLRATLKSQSLLTGKLYIDLSFYENKEAIYHDQDGKYLEIPTVPSELQQMSKAMQSLNFQELALKFSNTMDALEKMSVTLEQALNSETSKKELAIFFASLDTLRSILTTVDENIGPLLTKLDVSFDKIGQFSDSGAQMIGHIDGKIEPLLSSVENTARETSLAMRATEIFMSDMSHSLSMESPLYFQLTEGLSEVGKAAKAWRSFTETLDRNPQMLFLGNENPSED